MSNKWTDEEFQTFSHYIEACDDETIDECIEFARYMLYNESGLELKERSFSACKNKFYKELKKNSNVNNS